MNLRVRCEDHTSIGQHNREVIASSFIVTELPSGKSHCVAVRDADTSFHERSASLLRNDVDIATINWSDSPDREHLEAAVRQAYRMVSSRADSYCMEWGPRHPKPRGRGPGWTLFYLNNFSEWTLAAPTCFLNSGCRLR
jgi:hypothetical protein